MSAYQRMTLREFIEALRALPEGAMVRGLSNGVDSYRGYYERNAIDPDAGRTIAATVLADDLTGEDGKAIFGYKGGDYHVSLGELVYVAGYGDTGPAIIGIEPCEDGIYEAVLLEEDWHF